MLIPRAYAWSTSLHSVGKIEESILKFVFLDGLFALVATSPMLYLPKLTQLLKQVPMQVMIIRV